ncbi:RNA polymerase beta subunit chloroplast [Cinnamomum micranthum f. kanehirae]|uniref:DNA-directed RNA polymerase n=1 Tax=Cinnamomum micranthum f. kanehirae TaxID=337451 RepID=A0A3S3MP45_9MAGN|nr:RNA polymerase beta subunit chloroplast [Cinnamomum micranthum f. kanehirae]
MPYLQVGTPVDMDFNPSRVPSRINVGQIFECSLGLAGYLFDRHYRIAPFDETYEQGASRRLVFPKLYLASKQTANLWVFEPMYPGRSRIFDGITGDPFEQPIIIGKSYILKLIHQRCLLINRIILELVRKLRSLEEQYLNPRQVIKNKEWK